MSSCLTRGTRRHFFLLRDTQEYGQTYPFTGGEGPKGVKKPYHIFTKKTNHSCAVHGPRDPAKSTVHGLKKPYLCGPRSAGPRAQDGKPRQRCNMSISPTGWEFSCLSISNGGNGGHKSPFRLEGPCVTDVIMEASLVVCCRLICTTYTV